MKKWLFSSFVLMPFASISLISCTGTNYKNVINKYLNNSFEIKVMDGNAILGYATGFIHDSKILTKKHIIVKENAQYFYRKNNENDWTKTNLIASSDVYDLALFSYEGISSFKKKLINPNIGDKVFFVGNPQGYGLGVGEGIVSTFNKLT